MHRPDIEAPPTPTRGSSTARQWRVTPKAVPGHSLAGSLLRRPYSCQGSGFWCAYEFRPHKGAGVATTNSTSRASKGWTPSTPTLQRILERGQRPGQLGPGYLCSEHRCRPSHRRGASRFGCVGHPEPRRQHQAAQVGRCVQTWTHVATASR